MNKIPFERINHQITLLGGQSFAWDFIDGSYYGFTQDFIIKLKFNDDEETLEWQTYPENDRSDIVESYLSSKNLLKEVKNSFPKDNYLEKAIETYGNILILNQPFEEALLSYLITPTNNIPSIRYRIREMNKRLGNKIIVDDKTFFTFPTPERIANTELNTLLESKLGFHAKFVQRAASKFIDDRELVPTLISSTDSEAVRAYLKSYSGIGNKVADCIMVYGNSRYSEFPLDIWGQRIMQRYYNLPETMKYEDVRNWIKNYFGIYAGWAGQYLYEYIRLIEGK
jgi:N-glycosylase/DNA lyase